MLARARTAEAVAEASTQRNYVLERAAQLGTRHIIHSPASMAG